MSPEDIHLAHGVGDLIFGMSQEQVISILGAASDEEVTEEGDIELSYDPLGIRCTFWATEGFHLGVISVERPTSILCGEHLIGKSKADIRSFVTNTLHATVSEEGGCRHEDGGIQEWLEVDDRYVTFWFWDDALYLIDCFCPWRDENTCG